MAGLVPAIHDLAANSEKKGVDARHKAGHDDCGSGSAVLKMH
jgi:hypothetical protein